MAKTYVDEIVGGDGMRRYNLVRDDGSMAAQNVQIVKAYTPEQEGSTFGAVDVYDLQCKEYTVTLTADGWVDGQQTVSLPEIQADAGTVFVSLPADATLGERKAVARSVVQCVARNAGELVFKAMTFAPLSDVSLQVILTAGSPDFINALPSAVSESSKVELCRFIKSGTFNPSQYPTADGKYDVYIVGGGGGARGRQYRGGYYEYSNIMAGGGGGYAKLLKDLTLNGSVAVTIGAAGTTRTWNNSMSSQEWEGGSDGGNTSFGKFGTANGGARATDSGTGGSGGSGGAGFGCLIGGINGNDGGSGSYESGFDGDYRDGSGGTGGGNVDYCPTNPYDGLIYGIGGNSEQRSYTKNGDDFFTNAPALNDNPGRGGGATASALPGVCIVYGIPKTE